MTDLILDDNAKLAGAVVGVGVGVGVGDFFGVGHTGRHRSLSSCGVHTRWVADRDRHGHRHRQSSVCAYSLFLTSGAGLMTDGRASDGFLDRMSALLAKSAALTFVSAACRGPAAVDQKKQNAIRHGHRLGGSVRYPARLIRAIKDLFS